MSMMVSFVLSFFPRDVLDEILKLIESVSEDFPSYSCFLFIMTEDLFSDSNRNTLVFGDIQITIGFYRPISIICNSRVGRKTLRN